MPGGIASHIRRVATHAYLLQLLVQATKNLSFLLRHLRPIAYNEKGNGNANLRVPQLARGFLFYTCLELMIIFVGLPNIFGRVTIERLSASQ